MAPVLSWIFLGLLLAAIGVYVLDNTDQARHDTEENQ